MPNPFDQFDAPPQQGGVIYRKPADPMQPLDASIKQGQIAAQQRAAQAFRIQQAAAQEALIAARNKNKATAIALTQANSPASRLSPPVAADLRSRKDGLRNLEGSLAQLEAYWRNNYSGRPMGRLVPDFASPTNQQFDSLSQQMGPYVMAALGLSGKSTDAAAEYKQKVLPFIPDSMSFDSTNLAKLRNLRRMLNTQKEAVNQQLGIPYHKVKGPDPLRRGSGKPANDGWRIEEVK